MNTTITSNRFVRPRKGFSLIEVLFAIGMLGVGIVAILSLFTTGIASAAYSGNLTTAAMEAQSLFTRVISDVTPPPPPPLTRTFLYRMAIAADNGAGAPDTNWIQSANNGDATPVKIDNNRDLFWNCRSSKHPMSLDQPLDSSKDDMKTTYPKGLYQIAIAVYRNVKPTLTWPGVLTNPPKEPVVVYTTLVTVY